MALYHLIQGGITVLTLFDWYCASYGLLLVAFSELIAVTWIYGKAILFELSF